MKYEKWDIKIINFKLKTNQATYKEIASYIVVIKLLN